MPFVLSGDLAKTKFNKKFVNLNIGAAKLKIYDKSIIEKL